MRSINIQEAKTHLSRLADEAHDGKSFIIAKAGRPVAQVNPLQNNHHKKERKLGTLGGIFKVPDHFDTMDQKEIEEMFSGKE